ncbi:MAG: DnaA regulatory inactivator Hda [Gammaproteobacteria bacterium]
MNKQLTLNVRLRDDATFANFYTGDNQLVVNYLEQFLRGNYSERLVYLWGASGVGRSHLLHACCHTAVAQQQHAGFLPLIENAALSPTLLEGLETFSLLCVDDVQAIAGNHAWEEALFHLYNRISSNPTRWIIAADAPPQQIHFALPDLQSRLAGAVVFRIHSLPDEQKAAALRSRAQLRGLIVSEEISQFLLTHYSRDMGTLFSALDKLDLASLAAQRKLTVPFVKAVLNSTSITV